MISRGSGPLVLTRSSLARTPTPHLSLYIYIEGPILGGSGGVRGVRVRDERVSTRGPDPRVIGTYVRMWTEEV